MSFKGAGATQELSQRPLQNPATTFKGAEATQESIKEGATEPDKIH